MKSRYKIALIILFFAAVVIGTANFALAQNGIDLGLEAGEQIGLGNADPKTVIVNVVRVMLGFLALIAVILIIYGGFVWMTAGGNAEKIEKAKKILRNAAIGLVIILSAFGIVSFLMTKLMPPPPPCVGPDCPGNCEPPCADGLTCCPGDFCAESCGTPSSDSFLISRTVPRNNDANVIRNIVIRAFFNEPIDNTTGQTALENNFVVEDMGQVAKSGELIAKNYPPKIIAMEAKAQSGITGNVASSSAWQEINFRALAECGDEKNTPNCLPGSRRIRVTINGASGIKSVEGQSLSCAGVSCAFTFTTGELIDTEAPISGIIPAQMCKDDGSLKPDANTVGGWGRDDIAIAKLEFFSEASGGSENLVHLEPGNLRQYQYLDWKYDTSAMNIGDSYAFKVRSEDLAASSSVASFSTTIKPGHCCNGVKDAGEEDVDCGGADCLACVGAACNAPETPNQCSVGGVNNCRDDLCSSWFCPCTTDDCLCNVKPMIKAVTPEGGFCDGDINKFCQSDADCAGVGGGTCNTETPNGAVGNFITIHGQNFGTTTGEVFFATGNNNKYASVVNSRTTDEVWRVQLKQLGTNLRDNITYAGSFKAKSADSGNIDIQLQREVDPWESFIGDDIVIPVAAGDWKTYNFAFTPKNLPVDKNQIRFTIYLGKLLNVSIDDIEIHEQANPSINLIRNGSFNDGQNDWFLEDHFGISNFGIKTQASSWIKAKLANDGTDGNSACGNEVWKDSQIIVIVPDGAKTGPVKVKSGVTGYSDVTDDVCSENNCGPKINDFLVNTISRPGICLLDPYKGNMSTLKIDYSGIKMNGGKAYFGNLEKNAIGLEPNVFNDKFGNSKVPNIETGLTSSFVVKNNVNSNFLEFIKDDEPYLGPLIESFDPKIGASGQYVTIRGRGFGNARGESQVFFGNESGKEAAYNFPKVCAESVWTDNQVIIKVPAGITDGLNLLTMKIGNVVINTSELATPKFEVKSSEPLKPSLCKIQPVMGPIGQPISFWGEYFGAKDANSKIKFYLNKYQSGSGIGFWGTEDAPDGIDPDKATTTVSVRAASGPVYVIKGGISCKKDDDCGENSHCVNKICELEGNSLNFRVGECSKSEECGSEAVCCPADSSKKGRCAAYEKDESGKVVKSSVEDLCYDDFKSCVYEWDFDTSPRIGQPCDGKLDNNKCDPDESMCGSELICYNNKESAEDLKNCTCQLPCDKDNDKENGCNKDDNKCKSELGDDYVCDPNSDCTCQPTYTESCSGYDIEQCAYNYCSGPKKPGQCSVNVKPKEGNKCNTKYCEDLCGGKACEYSETLDKCADKAAICGLSHKDTIHGTDGKDYPVDKYCAAYKGKFRWQVKNFENCNLLGNSWRNAGGSVCADIGSECGGTCKAGLDCVGENGKDNNGDGTPDANWTGICGVDRPVCGLGYKCGDGVCKQEAEGSCECCCQKSENKYDTETKEFKYNPQCCAPLKCGSECGESVGKPDKVCKKTDGALTNKKCDTVFDCDSAAGETCVENLPAKDFGLCTMCTVKNNDGTINQKKSDEACNCPGSDGKYCDAAGDGGNGVCRECGELSYFPAECTAHDASCCVDGKDGNACRGITQGGGTVKEGGLAYCGYYDCTTDDSYQCDVKNPTKDGTHNSISCDGKCGAPVGTPCKRPEIELCQTGADSCEATYDCLTLVYDSVPQGDCRCCCDPDKTGTDKTDLTTYDTCRNLDSGKLGCKPDKEPCTTEERGLCCGCEADNDCVVTGEQAVSVGCSSVDQCCRARPDVLEDSEMPKNGQKDACRNGQISAVFNERMDIQSFPSNIIVAGEYNGKCPDGTVYVALEGNEPGFFKRLIARISGLVKKIIHFRSNEALALAPAAGNNYCAVPGTVSGYQTAGKKTEIIFTINKLLDPGRQYYVIIKGDENLDSRSGVLSSWRIGMNGKGYDNPDTAEKDWNETTSVTFNGKTYKNSHVWTFKTMDTKSANNGVCVVKDVKIDPGSYLYKTNLDDLAENDADDNDRTFDTAYDIDKVFLSKALSKDGQVLVPVEEYGWDWKWAVDNESVAKISDAAGDKVFSNNSPESDRQLIRANEKKTDGQTHASSTVIFNSENKVGQKSGSVSGKAKIWVFICDNPWPAIENGLWAPWIDSGAESFCNAGKTGSNAKCQDTNYELYYCRDSGAAGTADDLPVIKSSSIFRRDPDTKILKEVYYLRGQLPAGGYDLFGLTGGSSDSGEAVLLHWNAQSYVDNYKVYYGVASGDYIFNKSISVIAEGTPEPKQVLCQSGSCEYLVSGLTSGQTYYFAITSFNKTTGAESAYSSEISAKAEDKIGPDKVSNVIAALSNKQVKLEYSLATGAVSSTVFYKAIADASDCSGDVVFGGSVKGAQKDGKGSAVVKSLTNGHRYCFGVVSYDSSINPSATTTISAVPFSNLSNLKAESAEAGKARLSWGAAEGIAGYSIYQKKDGDEEYAEVNLAVSPDYTYYNLDGLKSGKKYYFKVDPKNIDGVKDVYLNEVSVVIK